MSTKKRDARAQGDAAGPFAGHAAPPPGDPTAPAPASPASALGTLEALLPALLTGRERMPAWGGAALALAVAGLALCAWQWQRATSAADAAEERAVAAALDRQAAVAEFESLRGEAARLRIELGSQAAEAGAQGALLAARDAELAAVAARADALQRELDVLEAHGGDVAAVLRDELAAVRGAQGDLEAAAAEARTAASSARGERDVEAAARAESDARLAATEAELARAREPAAQATLRAAVVLDWLGAGRARDALVSAQALVLEHGGEPGLAGLQLFTALTHAAVALDDWGAETEVGRRDAHLALAGERLAEASAVLAPPGGEGVPESAWLALLETGELYGRARIQAAIDALEARLDAARGDSSARREEEWLAAASSDPLRDPGPLIAWARVHGEAAPLAPMVDEVAAALAAVEAPEGSLKPRALAAVPALASWAEFLREPSALAELPGARSVRRFAVAARWIDADPSNDALDWELVDVPAPEALAGAPSRSWTAVLALEHALAAPGSGFPLPRAGRLVYQVSAPDGAPLYFEVEYVDAGASGTNGEWTLQRSLHGLDGRQLSLGPPYVVAALGWAPLQVEERASGRQLASLRGELDGAVAAWSLSAAELPAALDPIVPSWAVAELRALWSAPRAALVLTRGGRERWYVPGLGLVRERRAGDTRELVAADLEL